MVIRRTKKINSNLQKFINPKIDFVRKVIKTKYMDGNESDIQKIMTRFLNESKIIRLKYLTIWTLKEKNRKGNAVIGLHPGSILGKVLWYGEVKEFR